MTESDGIYEALDGQFRLAISVAGQIGELIARARENTLRRARAVDENEARDLTAHLDAERSAARAELATVRDPGWWDHATTGQVAHAWQVSRAWAADDPDVRAAAERIRSEIRERYGIDVNNTGANPADVQAALDRALAEQRDATTERRAAAAEESETAFMMRQADAVERRAEEAGPDGEQATGAAVLARGQAGLAYDSAERRQRLANDLEAKGVAPDVVDTHVRADVGQATPPAAAVAARNAPRSKTTRRPGRTATRRHELQR